MHLHDALHEAHGRPRGAEPPLLRRDVYQRLRTQRGGCHITETKVHCVAVTIMIAELPTLAIAALKPGTGV